MAATESNMLPLGTKAPSFALPDVASGQLRRLEELAAAKPVLVIFLCAHCPYVLHVAPELSRVARDYADKPLAIVAITSNDILQYPQDGPEPTARFAEQFGLSFPILFDETQSVAHAYSAACTPDSFLFDAQHRLFYRGQIDGSRPRRGEAHGADLRAALDAVLAGAPAPQEQHASIGCNIKWKTGNEPSASR